MKSKKSFVLYHDYWEWLKLLSDEELGKIFKAIFIYERENEVPVNFDPKLEMAFTMIKETLDRDKLKYEQVCNRNKEVAKMRWQKMKECGIDVPPMNDQ